MPLLSTCTLPAIESAEFNKKESKKLLAKLCANWLATIVESAASAIRGINTHKKSVARIEMLTLLSFDTKTKTSHSLQLQPVWFKSFSPGDQRDIAERRYVRREHRN